MEERFFLQILGDYVHGRATALPEGELDWERLCELARKQDLSGVVFAQCRGLLQSETTAWQKLHRGFQSEIFYGVCRQEDLRETAVMFRERKIPFLLMKGMVLARYHPIPQLRTMGDIDLVIRPEDRQRAHQVMEELGFHHYVDNHAVWTYRRDVVEYEIHDQLLYDELANRVDYRSYFAAVWDRARTEDGVQYVLDPHDQFLQLIAHTAKHILHAGTGFRAFLDMVFLARDPALNRERLEQELKRLELWEFAQTCSRLCGRWFGAELPIPGRELEEDFCQTVTEKVFADGTFGLHNRENQVGHTTKEIKRSGMPYLTAAMGVTVKKLFPPYRDMQLIPQYAFVDGRPWMLPAAWVYRFWYCAKHKPEHSEQLLKQPFARREEILERERLMRAWGL